MIDLVSFIPRAIVQSIPLLYGSTGETITEKSGNLNLGIPGVMYVGGICGVIGAFFYEQAAGGAEGMNGFLAIAIPLVCCLVGSLLISALVIFPALSAMRIFRSFLHVTICSAVISVVCSFTGIVIAILAGTPVGSTIVAVQVIGFAACCAAGALTRGAV